jgi:hypothetical protein
MHLLAYGDLRSSYVKRFVNVVSELMQHLEDLG